MANDDSTPALNENPILRFRLRTLLVATTVIAVLAAIAGPYYRRQSPAAQSQLLTFWAGMAVAGGLIAWFQWRAAWRLPLKSGDYAFVLWAAPKSRRPWGRWNGQLFCAALWLIVVIYYSEHVANRADRRWSSIWGALATALNGGFFTGTALLWAIPRPAFLAARGISNGQAFALWKYIRHAEWLADRPGVLKFRRLDGDIYVEVPARMRGEVEAFVRTKTAFVESAPGVEAPATPSHDPV